MAKKKHREGIFNTIVTEGFPSYEWMRVCWLLKRDHITFADVTERINPPSSPSLTARGSLMGSKMGRSGGAKGGT